MWNDPCPASPGAGMLFFGLLTAMAVADPALGKLSLTHPEFCEPGGQTFEWRGMPENFRRLAVPGMQPMSKAPAMRDSQG